MYAGYVKRIALLETMSQTVLVSSGVGVAAALLGSMGMQHDWPVSWSWPWYRGGVFITGAAYSLFMGWLWTMEMHRTDCLEEIEADFPNAEAGAREIRKQMLLILFGNPLTWPIGLGATLLKEFAKLVGRDWRISVPVCAALTGLVRSQIGSSNLGQIAIYASIGALLGLFLVPDIRRKFLF